MAFQNGYRGTAGGSVQTTYTDQPGIALPGMLAFASDLNMCDAIFIGETGGIRAGAGVALAHKDDGLGFHRPPFVAVLPDVGQAAADFGGIVVFDEAMQCDENGVPGWAKNRVARVLRPGRGGGRIYVLVKDAVDIDSASVNWVTVVDSAGKYELGDFVPSALGGGSAGTTVALTNAQFVTNAAADGYAMLELFGNVMPLRLDDESA